jgi:hypothetical protein
MAQRRSNGQEPAGDNFSHRDLSRRTGYPHVNSFLIQEPVMAPAHWPVRPAGSAGTLFLYGIVAGAVAVLGLTLLLAGARRTSRRGHDARRGLKESRRQRAAVSRDRDGLLDQRETARASTAGTLGDAPAGDRHPSADAGGRHGMRQLSGHRSASPQAATPPAQAVNGHPAPDVPADASAATE